MTERPVLGIDLGTTYSCVASLDENQRVSVLPNQEGELTTPSVVFFEQTGSVTVGKFAKNELKREQDRVVALIKRHMGEDGYTVEIDGKAMYPQQISAIILRQVVEDALSDLGLEVPASGQLADAVITVPAYFGAAERQATRDAGEMAGLNVVNIINEPTAAAIAYGLASAGSDRTVLVYDLGGGTFDVTIIRVSPSEIRVVATGGDHRLGGADWDERVVEMIATKFQEQHPDADDPRLDLDAAGSIELFAEEAKKALSRRDSYVDSVTAGSLRAKIEISRKELEECTSDLVGRTLDFTRDVLRQAQDKGVQKIDELLLVGGMSRTPAVSQRLATEFPELPDAKLTDPDQIVAKGAALFAASSVAETDASSDAPVGRRLPGAVPLPAIIDVTSKGYGIEVVRESGRPKAGTHLAWLIRPNDEVPATVRDTFRTVSDNQETVEIVVYESTTDVLTENVTDHVKLVEGRLVGLPSRQSAGRPIVVSFALGADAILRITALAENGRELTLEARISGLVPDEVKRAPLPALQR
ncbi:Hsp70 family protein [Solihabitans fulvus]|nr:Hsp70 family protein [Solihabitans fulvus]